MIGLVQFAVPGKTSSKKRELDPPPPVVTDGWRGALLYAFRKCCRSCNLIAIESTYFKKKGGTEPRRTPPRVTVPSRLPSIFYFVH